MKKQYIAIGTLVAAFSVIAAGNGDSDGHAIAVAHGEPVAYAVAYADAVTDVMGRSAFLPGGDLPVRRRRQPRQHGALNRQQYRK